MGQHQNQLLKTDCWVPPIRVLDSIDMGGACEFGFATSSQEIESILKSRDITLPAKVCLVKAMVLPVVMYGCESWTIKKAECQRIEALNCDVGEDS